MQRKEDLLSGVAPDRSTAKVWIVHRIDKGTSGALVFAKSERAKDILPPSSVVSTGILLHPAARARAANNAMRRMFFTIL